MPWGTPNLPPVAAHPFEMEVVQLVNVERARGAICGGQWFPPAGPVVVSPQLMASARGHSWDMAIGNYMAHTSRDGRSASERMRAAGYYGGMTGENIARGYASPSEVMTGWMQSAGHCRNVMSPHFRFVGVGYVFTPANEMRHYWTQNFGG
jgi:uncharacterized protein YkwD